MLKTQQRFKNEKINLRSIDLIETYAHGMNEDLVCKKEEIIRNIVSMPYQI